MIPQLLLLGLAAIVAIGTLAVFVHSVWHAGLCAIWKGRGGKR